MKIHRIHRKAAFVAALFASAAAASFSYAKPDQTQEKIRLMVAAVQARDSGDLKTSKQQLEELLKIAPNDEGVQRMLADVNKDIERQSKGEQPVLSKAKPAVAETAAKPEAKADAADEAKAEETAKVEPVDAAMADTLRKQQLQVIAAFDLIDEAYDLMDDGNWDAAAGKLSLAGEKIPSEGFAPVFDEVRGELNRAKATMAKSRAKIAMSEKDTAAAKDFAAEYAASEENKDKGAKFVKQVDEYTSNPYNNTIADIGPEYANRQKKIDNLLEKGRRQYLYGDYQGARATFRQIETLDADNIQSKAYQRLISEKLANSGRLTYLATREAMMDEVNKAWQRPQVYSGATVDKGGATSESAIDKKLKDIIIPVVEFNAPGVTLFQAISTLSDISVQYDKATDSQKGVNIVLFEGDAADSKPIAIKLRDKPLGVILDMITRMAGFQYDVENDTVVVRKAVDGTAASMDTLDFPLPTSTVTRMLGIKAMAGDSGDSSNPFGGGGGDSSSSGDDKESAIKSFLVKAGIEFGPGASLAYDGSKLWVTNTSRNLDKVRNILLRYSEVKQVEIEAKFMEVNQGVLKELGFNWNLARKNADGSYDTIFSTVGRNATTGVISSYNNRTLAGSVTSASAGGTPISIYTPGYWYTPSSGTPVYIETSNQTIQPTIPALPSAINMASGAAQAANTILGVINGYDLSLIVNALEQRQGSDLLCAPKVTVTDGYSASITVSQRMRYPQSWNDVQSNVGSSSSSTNGSSSGSAGVTITPGTPQEFQDVDVGVTMTVTPTVGEDGSITLDLQPNVTEFEGFMEYGGVAVAISSGTTVTVPSGFIQPVFSIREVKTQVTVFDGATVVLGGLTREEVRSVNDSVPVLGDIPWVGRLFRSKGESRQKRNLIIFVTANRISPGGSIGREQFQDMRPGSVYQNPIVVSPGGAVHRVLEDGSSK